MLKYGGIDKMVVKNMDKQLSGLLFGIKSKRKYKKKKKIYKYPKKSPSYTSRGKIYKKTFHLPIETAIYVPSTDKNQKLISKAQLKYRVNEVRAFLATKYGGYTSTKSTGGYVGKKGKLIKEPAVKVTSFTTFEDFKKHKYTVKKKIKFWCKKWGQEAIGYEYEGDMYYISQ